MSKKLVFCQLVSFVADSLSEWMKITTHEDDMWKKWWQKKDKSHYWGKQSDDKQTHIIHEKPIELMW